MHDWRRLDRTSLGNAVARFLLKPPRILVIRGSDEDSRYVAGHVTAHLFEERYGRAAVRISEEVTAPVPLRSMLLQAWRQTDRQYEPTEIHPSVGKAGFVTIAEILVGICSSMDSRSHKILLQFDTIDAFVSPSISDLQALETLVRGGAHVIVFSRREAATTFPLSFDVFDLSDMALDDIEATLLSCPPSSAVEQALALLKSLDVLTPETRLLPSNFVYEMFEAEVDWTAP